MNSTLIGFIRKELIQSLRDPRMRLLLLVTPILQLSLFGFAISNEIKNIKLSASFSTDDVVMRQIYERALASGWFITSDRTKQDPYAIIEAAQADAVLVPPPGGLTRALGRGDAKIQLLINAVNATKAQVIDGYLNGIIQNVVREHLKAPPLNPPLVVEQRVLFNPDLDTAAFMVPGIMAMIMLITTLVLANLAIVREKELGTFEMLISAPVSKSEVIYGKTIPYVVLGMSNFPLILGVAVFVFGVPMRGNILVLLIAALAFVCTSVALGSLISTFCKNQQQATLAAFLVLFPLIMFSGLFFPVENMPTSIRWVALVDPLAHYLGLLRNIMLKGGGTEYVLTHVGALTLTALLTIFVSRRRFSTTL